MENCIEPIKKSFNKAAEEFDNGIDDAIRRWEESTKAMKNNNAAVLPDRVQEVRTSSNYGYNEEAVKYLEEYEIKLGEVAEKAQEPAKKLAETLKEQLGNFDVSSEPTERMKQELENTYEKLSMLQKKWQELSTAEPSDKVTSQLNSVEKQIISTTKQSEKLENKLKESTENSGFTKLRGQISQAASAISSKLGKAASSAGGKIKNTLGGAFNAVKKTGSKALGNLKNGFSKLMTPAKKLGSTIKSTFKSVFLAAGLYAAFRALKDGLMQAANADKEFSKSLNEVKANLSVAFTPIIQAIMPALNTLMTGLASVTNVYVIQSYKDLSMRKRNTFHEGSDAL